MNTTYVDNTRRREYTSARGITVTFLPLPPTIVEQIEVIYAQEVPRPEPPTYTEFALGGIEVVQAHNETTIKGDPEAEVAFDAYKKALAAWTDEVNTRLARYVQVNCVDFDLPESDDWIKRQEYAGLKVPDDPFDRRLYYLRTEFVGSQDDALNVLAIPMQLAMERSVDLVAAERFLRLGLERREAADEEGGGAVTKPTANVEDVKEANGDGVVGETADST